MTDQDHSTHPGWLQPFTDGDSDASQQLFDEYFDRLVRHAGNRLRNIPQRVAEPEDIASSVFKSLWRGASNGRFEDVKNRDELWWLLTAMTQRKVASHLRRQWAQKRGGPQPPISIDGPTANREGAQQLPSPSPSPDVLVAMDDEFQRLQALLPAEQLRKIAVLRLEGYTTSEISEQLNISTATVTRKLKLIRDTWKNEMAL